MWDMNPNQEFQRADGEQMTYAQYYKRQYDQNMTNTEQPLLVSTILMNC